ncbi:hypothetical protein LEP1GSC038_0710 [Leptospira weilii str. 2006001855]|uniref:Uncharacterized protein n=1 Tax=Leptospira weilii str. 2006001855 TaxID=996804 RepID=M6FVG7_9LEPT|nr:hypothetical protein LEP1GSC038_0710 [Leptospira weilii str. 2006001855]
MRFGYAKQSRLKREVFLYNAELGRTATKGNGYWFLLEGTYLENRKTDYITQSIHFFHYSIVSVSLKIPSFFSKRTSK